MMVSVVTEVSMAWLRKYLVALWCDSVAECGRKGWSSSPEMDLSSSARGHQSRGGNGVIEAAHAGVKICPDQADGEGDGDTDMMVWGAGGEIAESNEARLLLMIYSSPTYNNNLSSPLKIDIIKRVLLILTDVWSKLVWHICPRVVCYNINIIFVLILPSDGLRWWIQPNNIGDIILPYSFSLHLFVLIFSNNTRGNNSEKTIYNIYRIFEGRYHTYTYYTVEREAGDYKQLLYHCYTSWESLVISTDLE